MRVSRRGADAWICSWDGGAQSTRRSAISGPAGFTRTSICGGPSSLPAGVVPRQHPLLLLQSLGLPLSGEMGPCVHGGPDYMCVFTFWVTFSRGSGSFLGRGHPRLPRQGGGGFTWSTEANCHSLLCLFWPGNNPKLCLSCCIFS